MTTPPGPISLSMATGIMLPDLTWHPLADSLGLVLAPAFVDPLQTDENGGPVLITPGEPWTQFVDVTTGQAFAAPFRSVVAVEISGAVAVAMMPHLVRGALAHAPQHAGKFPGPEALGR